MDGKEGMVAASEGSEERGPKTLVLVPTFNEAAGIELLLDRVLASHPTLEILVIDDDSPDGTGKIADERALADDRIQVLHRPSKKGLGKAYVAGFKLGLERGFDRLVEMDADLSHDPDDLPRLIEAAAGADLVIGSRYTKGGGVEGWSLARHVLSRSANAYSRTLLGFPVRDSTSGFRCYRREVLENLDLDTASSEGYAFQIEMAFRTWKKGFRVKEIPIVFRERSIGKSKMSGDIVVEGIRWVTKSGLMNLSRRFGGRRPAPPR